MQKIFGQIGRIKPECIEEYTRLQEVDVYSEKWSGVLELIRQCNIQNYSIFIEDDVVFGYFEYTGEDYEADMKKMSDDPLNKEWWAHTRPCFTKYKEGSQEAFYTDMKQIFHW